MKLTLAASALLGILASPAFAATVLPIGHFDSLSLRGGGHIVVKHGPSQSVTLLKGSTQFTKFTIRHENELEIDACNDECPRSYDLEIEIVTPDLSGAAIEGGGHIEAASGFPNRPEFSAAVDGGGHLDVQAVIADKVIAAVNGGGHIQVSAKRELSAAINGGGSIVYRGNPQVSSAIDGGGSVSRESK